jgi:hypothetical protein
MVRLDVWEKRIEDRKERMKNEKHRLGSEDLHRIIEVARIASNVREAKRKAYKRKWFMTRLCSFLESQLTGLHQLVARPNQQARF